MEWCQVKSDNCNETLLIAVTYVFTSTWELPGSIQGSGKRQ